MRISELVAILGGIMLLALVPSAHALQQGDMKFDEWGDTFDASELDTSKWERFSFEGGSGGTFKIENGTLSMRGINGSRSGVRSKQTFEGDQIIVDATVAKVGSAYPEPESAALPIGNAIVTLLFDGSGRNRIEWLLTSEGTFEAWAMIDGKGQRLDDRKLGTKIANPTLSIARRGDTFIFALNGQVGLTKTLKGYPKSARVMLYGFGTSENIWDSVRVTTVRPQAAPKP
jgi:hypothetical protein